MSSLPAPILRSASAGANKKRRLHLFPRRESPTWRKRPTSEYSHHTVIVSRAFREESGHMEARFYSNQMSCPAELSDGSGNCTPEPDIWKLYRFGSSEVAEELCLLDGEMLRKIDTQELHNGAWMKKEVSFFYKLYNVFSQK